MNMVHVSRSFLGTGWIPIRLMAPILCRACTKLLGGDSIWLDSEEDFELLHVESALHRDSRTRKAFSKEYAFKFKGPSGETGTAYALHVQQLYEKIMKRIVLQ